MTITRALAFALALAPLAAYAQEQPRVISAFGEGVATAKPDEALVSMGVSHQAPTAGQAMALMSDGIAGVLGGLSKAGIPAADVQTGQLTLEPAFDYSSSEMYPPVTGFIATQMVDVRVTDILALGPLLDAVVGQGVNRVNLVTFGLADREAALRDSRAAAMADAAARAATYAEAAGVTLGPLVSVVDGGSYDGTPYPMFAARDAEAGVPVATGQMSITTTVTVTYAIE